MGFWDGVGSIAKGIANNMAEKMDRINGIRARYESLDDQSLMNKFKSSTGEDKVAIGLLLKDRGYGSK